MPYGAMHGEYPGATNSPVKGRIDHANKEISLTSAYGAKRQEVESARDQLAKLHPDYTVHEFVPAHLKKDAADFEPQGWHQVEGTTPRYTERGPQRGRAHPKSLARWASGTALTRRSSATKT